MTDSEINAADCICEDTPTEENFKTFAEREAELKARMADAIKKNDGLEASVIYWELAALKAEIKGDNAAYQRAMSELSRAKSLQATALAKKAKNAKKGVNGKSGKPGMKGVTQSGEGNKDCCGKQGSPG